MSFTDMVTKPWDGFDVLATVLDQARAPTTEQPVQTVDPCNDDEENEDFDIHQMVF
jgi:hypothetical protein